MRKYDSDTASNRQKNVVYAFDHSVTCRYFEVGQFELYTIAREESNDGIFARFIRFDEHRY